MIRGYSGGKVIHTWVMCMRENVLDIIIIIIIIIINKKKE